MLDSKNIDGSWDKSKEAGEIIFLLPLSLLSFFLLLNAHPLGRILHHPQSSFAFRIQDGG